MIYHREESITYNENHKVCPIMTGGDHLYFCVKEKCAIYNVNAKCCSFYAQGLATIEIKSGD
jgi:hypothetical protein